MDRQSTYFFKSRILLLARMLIRAASQSFAKHNNITITFSEYYLHFEFHDKFHSFLFFKCDISQQFHFAQRFFRCLFVQFLEDFKYKYLHKVTLFSSRFFPVYDTPSLYVFSLFLICYVIICTVHS